jgi:hypothetical protein
MTHWSEEQYQEYLTRRRDIPSSDLADPGPESQLQGKIMKWAKARGYPYQSNRQTHRARGLLTPGWPDVTLILPHRVLFLELKSGAGRLSSEQKQLQLQFLALGHAIYQVRSYRKFLELVTIPTKET